MNHVHVPAPLDLAVYGIPRPQGSMRAYGSRVVHKNPDQLFAWRGEVAETVRRHLGEDWVALAEPCALALDFSMPRPQTHYRANDPARGLKDSAPVWVEAGADLDKLVRALFDALKSSGALADDRYVVLNRAQKRYIGAPNALPAPGVRIRLWTLTAERSISDVA